MMKYVYICSGIILTFDHKNMPNFRLNKSLTNNFHQRSSDRTAMLFHRHNALESVKGTQSLIYIKQLLPLQRQDR